MHIVVKLHPSENDEGPYRAVIEGIAAAGGFAPPPVTVVQTIDLYRLLAAADAHLGIHSTLLTEAVATGTPNLLAAGLVGRRPAGLRRGGRRRPGPDRGGHRSPCSTGRGARSCATADREAFLGLHFEPGDASRRIADDLLAWMGDGRPARADLGRTASG